MSYAKYMEDNYKIYQERQADYLLYHEVIPRREEYVPYAIKYQPPQSKQACKVRNNGCYCS